MAKTATKKVIGKVQITSMVSQWWESDLTDIFTNLNEVQILSAIEYDGGLYLIFLHDVEDDESQNL